MEENESTKFASKEQELQFFCKQYWKLLGIKDLYRIYKRKIWYVEHANQLSKAQVKINTDKFKAWILQIEQWADKYELLMYLFKKIS